MPATKSNKRREAAELVREAREIETKAADESRKLTEAEAERFDALMADAQEKLTEAKREEALEQLDAELSAERITGGGNPVRREADELDRVDGEADPMQGIERPAAEARDREVEGRRGFKFMGEFAAAVAIACDPARRTIDPRLNALMAATGGNQGVPADGGFLVPPSFGNQIWDGLRENPLDLVSRTDQFTVTGDSLTMPASGETSRAGGTVYGGVSASWLAEAAQIGASKPTFRRLKLEPQELAVLIYETDKLVRNSPIALEQFLQRAASDALGFKIGDAIIRGDGAGKPLGLLNSGALITVAKESGQAADTVVFRNITKMWARMHPRRRLNAVWLHNIDVEPQLMELEDPGSNQAVFLPAGGLRDAPFNTLLNRPLIPLEHCSTVGDVGDLILVDLSAYATGLRGGGAAVRTAVSIHLRFDYAETAFRFMVEIDGQPWLATAQTPAQGTNTLSTHVALAARA